MQYVVENEIIENWMYEFVGVFENEAEVDTYKCKYRKRVRITKLKNKSDKETYFYDAVETLNNELSPENLSCDGELGFSQIRYKKNKIMQKFSKLESESGLDLRTRLQD